MINDILEKINLLKDLSNLNEFKSYELAYSPLDILKIRYIYDLNKNDKNLDEYFENFNFPKTHLYIKKNNNIDIWIYFPKDKEFYINFVKIISCDIEVIDTKKFNIFVSEYWLNLIYFRKDSVISEDIKKLKCIEEIINKNNYDNIELLVELFNNYYLLNDTYKYILNEYKKELYFRKYIYLVKLIDIRNILLEKNTYDISLLSLKIKLIQKVINKWLKTIEDIINIKDYKTTNFNYLIENSINRNFKEFKVYQQYSLHNLKYNFKLNKNNNKNVLICSSLDLTYIDEIKYFDLIVAESESELSHTAIIARELWIPYILWAKWVVNWVKNLGIININYEKRTISTLK